MELIEHPCAVCGADQSRPYQQIAEWCLVRCSRCGVVYLNPSPTEDALRRLYTEAYYSSHHLQDDHSTKTVEQEIVQRMPAAKSLASEVQLPCRWLDVGCASGYLIAAGKRLGCEVEGVELSEWAASFAVQKLGLRVFCGKLGEYVRDSADRVFDLITAMAYLEHSPAPMEDLRAMAGLLPPNGVLVVRLPNLGSFDRRWHGDQWRGWSLPYHLYHFAPRSLAGLMEQVGLTPYRLDAGFWNPLVHLREAIRGDGLRADHPLEGRPGIAESREGRPYPASVDLPLWKIHVKALLGRMFSGRDMVIYARK